MGKLWLLKVQTLMKRFTKPILLWGLRYSVREQCDRGEQRTSATTAFVPFPSPVETAHCRTCQVSKVFGTTLSSLWGSTFGLLAPRFGRRNLNVHHESSDSSSLMSTTSIQTLVGGYGGKADREMTLFLSIIAAFLRKHIR